MSGWQDDLLAKTIQFAVNRLRIGRDWGGHRAGAALDIARAIRTYPDAVRATIPNGQVIADVADVISPELKAAMGRAVEFIGAVESVMQTIFDDDAHDALSNAFGKVYNDVGILISASETP